MDPSPPPCCCAGKKSSFGVHLGGLKGRGLMGNISSSRATEKNPLPLAKMFTASFSSSADRRRRRGRIACIQRGSVPEIE